jgi:uncharacterized protein
MNLPRIILAADSHRIDAFIARSEEDRAQGLMECTSLEEGEGMLFVHDEPLEACFWMKNTPMDLSIAFIDDEGGILNVAEMDAQSLEGIRAEGLCRFVLEMNPGWFAQRGVATGSVLAGLPLPRLAASAAASARSSLSGGGHGAS